MDERRRGSSLEDTPTWAVSVVCLFFFLISFITDLVFHHLSEFLRRRKRKSLTRALEKIKTEMMIMGFISLLLKISEVPISKICVSEAVANSFLPCKDPVQFKEPVFSSANQIPAAGSKLNTSTLSVDHNTQKPYCEPKGMVSLMSREGVMELNIFISVLAVFHVLYCALTMCLGLGKMRRYKKWEKETGTLGYQIANDPRRFQLSRQTSFGRQHLKLRSDNSLLLWPICFIRQFCGSASKADYFTLRNGFIAANIADGSNFNFQKFLARAFDDDFEQVMGIRFWIWVFSMLFIFFSAHRFYYYYWLPFISLMIALAVGAKLEVIKTKMCVESCENNSVFQGNFLVKPSDDLFWFGRPKWLLHLLQFILIQNSFQLAFFSWTWCEYGLRSCFNRGTTDIAIRIGMGLMVLFTCGYVTLPLYALVNQMGSGMKRVLLTERNAKGLKNWHKKARHSVSCNRSSNSTRQSSSNSRTSDTDTIIHSSNAMRPPSSPGTTKEVKRQQHKYHRTDLLPAMPSISTPENTNEVANPKIITRESYDGEVSFGSSWKKLERSKGVEGIASIIEEDHVSADLFVDFNNRSTS